jgi:hypothetical protein
MSRTFHHGKRQIRVKGVKRSEPDLRRLGRALIEFARMQAEAEAEAEHGRGKPSPGKKASFGDSTKQTDNSAGGPT